VEPLVRLAPFERHQTSSDATDYCKFCPAVDTDVATVYAVQPQQFLGRVVVKLGSY